MANKKTKDEEEAISIPAAEPPNPARATSSPTGKRPRVLGKLSKPLYLIHHGKFTVTIPEETREVINTDPDSENYGNVETEVVVAEYDVSGTLPKDSKYGNRKVGVAHEIWDADEAEALKRRGFVEATDAEVDKSTKLANAALGGRTLDEIAAEERERAHRQMRNSPLITRTNNEEGR